MTVGRRGDDLHNYLYSHNFIYGCSDLHNMAAIMTIEMVEIICVTVISVVSILGFFGFLAWSLRND